MVSLQPYVSQVDALLGSVGEAMERNFRLDALSTVPLLAPSLSPSPSPCPYPNPNPYPNPDPTPNPDPNSDPSQVPLLASLPLQEREGLLDRLEEVPYSNGETILLEGDTTDAFFYIVKRGHVAISKELAPSRPISKQPAPAAAASPSAAQGGGKGVSKVSELTPQVSERLALATLGRGEYFGEMALLPGAVPGEVRARGATVRACGHWLGLG